MSMHARCRISFKWVMQEKSQAVITPESPNAIPSASMAGGLFAIRADWFWELGGWGSQREPDFLLQIRWRVLHVGRWKCRDGVSNLVVRWSSWVYTLCLNLSYLSEWVGGCQSDCYCSVLFRGSGYSSPATALWKNRLRTARIWTGEYYQLVSTLVSHPNFDIGPLDKVSDDRPISTMCCRCWN